MTTLAHRPIHQIADEIIRDWKKPYFGATPYLSAMKYLSHRDDSFIHDSAKDVVLYFLANANTWRGETARRIKKELKEIIK